MNQSNNTNLVESNNTNLAVSNFELQLSKGLEEYYRSTRSDNAKRGWQIRRRNEQRKFAM